MNQPIRFDMSEHGENSQQLAVLTELLRAMWAMKKVGSWQRRSIINPIPFSFDEVEKAHPDIFNVLFARTVFLTDKKDARSTFQIPHHDTQTWCDSCDDKTAGFGQRTSAFDQENMEKRMPEEPKRLIDLEFINRIDERWSS